jgi:hypothetical protein
VVVKGCNRDVLAVAFMSVYIASVGGFGVRGIGACGMARAMACVGARGYNNNCVMLY